MGPFCLRFGRVDLGSEFHQRDRSRLEIEEVRLMLRVGLWRTPALVGVRGHLQMKGNSWSQSSVPEADEKRVSRRECSVL